MAIQWELHWFLITQNGDGDFGGGRIATIGRSTTMRYSNTTGGSRIGHTSYCYPSIISYHLQLNVILWLHRKGDKGFVVVYVNLFVTLKDFLNFVCQTYLARPLWPTRMQIHCCLSFLKSKPAIVIGHWLALPISRYFTYKDITSALIDSVIESFPFTTPLDIGFLTYFKL